MEHREVLDHLSPYLDNELDAVSSRELASHLATCASCNAELVRLKRVSETLRANAGYHRAPEFLRERILRDTRAAERRPEPARAGGFSLSWRLVAGFAALAVVIGGVGGSLLASRENANETIVREAVSDHIRSLMAEHLNDVASTDQHTVKPWFNGKLDFSPSVADFAAQGYPLIGGRLDYLDGRAVAALVYQRRKHVVNVFTWPTASGRDVISANITRQGYHVIRATHAGMEFCFVSDLNSEELGAFARMVTAEMKGM